MYRFVRALRTQDIMSFKEQFRSVDVLMIDDVQFISGKDSTQEEFFHTFNALVDQGRQIVISADKSPYNLEGIEERLKSRMGCGLVADIHATTYELRLGILDSTTGALPLTRFKSGWLSISTSVSLICIRRGGRGRWLVPGRLPCIWRSS
jgi:chromosomal replication initiation ATPase DnaA